MQSTSLQTYCLWEVKFPPKVNLHFSSLGGLQEVLPCLVVDDRFLALFYKGDGAQQWSCFGWLPLILLLLQGVCEHCQHFSWHHPYCPCNNAVLHPDRMYTIVPLTPQNLHSGSSLIPYCCKLSGVSKVSYTARRRKDMRKGSSLGPALVRCWSWIL